MGIAETEQRCGENLQATLLRDITQRVDVQRSAPRASVEAGTDDLRHHQMTIDVEEHQHALADPAGAATTGSAPGGRAGHGIVHDRHQTKAFIYEETRT